MSGLEEGTPGPFSSFSARPVSLRGFILNALPSRLPISNNISMTMISIFCSIESPPLIFFLIEHQSPKWVQSRLPNQMQKENLLIFPNLSARCIGTWKYFLYYPKLWTVTEKKIILGSTGGRTSGINLWRQILLNQKTLQPDTGRCHGPWWQLPKCYISQSVLENNYLNLTFLSSCRII